MSFPRYERYKNSGEGWLSEVPAHWRVMSNKAFLRNTNDLVGTGSSDFILLSLTLSDVIVRNIASGKGKFPAEFDSYKAVKSNDLVFCLFDLDETPRTIGLANHEGIITGAYEVLRCRPVALPSYVCYFYLHVDEFKGLRPWYTGLRKVVRPETFMSIKLALPPLEEQEAIASFLDNETAKIDALIEEQRRLIDLLKEKRQAVISHAVTKGLNGDAPTKDSEVEWLGDVPAHWPVHILKRAFRSMDYGISESLDSEGVAAILRMGNIQNGQIVMDDLKYIDAVDPALILKEGDLLYNRTNSLDLIGKVGMFHWNPSSAGELCFLLSAPSDRRCV